MKKTIAILCLVSLLSILVFSGCAEADPLEEALDALEQDHDYLTAGGVFPEALLRNFIRNKRSECRQMAAIPHPAEFERYYNL